MKKICEPMRTYFTFLSALQEDALAIEFYAMQQSPISQAERDALYKTIYLRRDTRSEFTDEPICEKVLHRILHAAHHAPSVGFMQPWDFILVKDYHLRTQIKEGFEKAHFDAARKFEGKRREQYKTFKLEGILEAPLGVCITCERTRNGPTVIGRTAQPEMDLYSTVCAVQNFWLAARAENLGVGWVSIISYETLKSILNIPEHITPIAYLCVGHVTHFHEKPELEEANWLDRLELDDLIHQNTWQTKKPHKLEG